MAIFTSDNVVGSGSATTLTSSDPVAIVKEGVVRLNTGGSSSDTAMVFEDDESPYEVYALISGQLIALDGTGLALLQNYGRIEITDTGLIDSGGDYGISSYTSNTDGIAINNAGTVRGALGAVATGNGDDTVINRGLLEGTQFTAMELNGGTDTVVNMGTIIGDVFLGDGADFFDGRGGDVLGRVLGGTGDDFYIIDDAEAFLSEEVNEGTDTVQSSVSYTLESNFEDLILSGSDNTTGIGNDIANTITGNMGDNRLRGNEGNDTLSGGEGDDRLWGGLDDDTLSGDNGDDTLRGQDGNDTMNGGNGNDTIYGGAGGDELRGDSDDDVLYGQAGNDDIFGGNGDDHLIGGRESDDLRGGGGDDLMDGGRDRDDLRGGDGDDILIGGMDGDDLSGGAGNDVFVFSAATDSGITVSDRDDITDFVMDEDIIDVSALGLTFVASYSVSGTAELRVTDDGVDSIVRIDLDGDGNDDMRIDVEGVIGLDAGDFIF